MEFEGVKVVHFIPGRVRLRVDRLRGEPAFADKVRERLSAVDAIRHVDASDLTGSVLVEYDPVAIARPESIDGLVAALNDLFPTFDTNVVHHWLAGRR